MKRELRVAAAEEGFALGAAVVLVAGKGRCALWSGLWCVLHVCWGCRCVLARLSCVFFFFCFFSFFCVLALLVKLLMKRPRIHSLVSEASYEAATLVVALTPFGWSTYW